MCVTILCATRVFGCLYYSLGCLQIIYYLVTIFCIFFFIIWENPLCLWEERRRRRRRRRRGKPNNTSTHFGGGGGGSHGKKGGGEIELFGFFFCPSILVSLISFPFSFSFPVPNLLLYPPSIEHDFLPLSWPLSLSLSRHNDLTIVFLSDRQSWTSRYWDKLGPRRRGEEDLFFF